MQITDAKKCIDDVICPGMLLDVIFAQKNEGFETDIYFCPCCDTCLWRQKCNVNRLNLLIVINTEQQNRNIDQIPIQHSVMVHFKFSPVNLNNGTIIQNMYPRPYAFVF